MKQLSLLIALFVLCPALLRANHRNYVITDYGVSSDSTQLNTKNIQRVIDSAAAGGGGTIVIPKGVFLTGALFFKPGTSLELRAGAVLKGSDDIRDYPLIPSRMEGHNLMYYAALINAYFVDGFTITGPGLINGNGQKFWATFWNLRKAAQKTGKSMTGLQVSRPRLLFIWGCNQVKLQKVKLYNSGFWTTHLYKCQNVVIDSCDIRAPWKPVPAPSSDGIDLDACSNITIRHCYISVNDDGIAVKGGKGPDAHLTDQNGPVENILIEDCSFGPVHAALTMGSECIHAKNIVLRNCTVNNDRPILNLKMRPDTYQIYENIHIENITGQCGSIIRMAPWSQYFNMAGSKARPYGIVRNISFSNIHVTCKDFGIMAGNPKDQVDGVDFKDMTVQVQDTAFKNVYDQVHFQNVMVNGHPFPQK